MFLHCKNVVMPKTKTPTQTESLSLTMPANAMRMLESLVPAGLHGGSRAEVARSLILSRLEDLVAKGLVKIQP